MTREPNLDEMFSAYLDDELSSEEREQVERAFVDKDHQRELNDLTALSHTIRDLPKFQLDDGFTERVLSTIAERQTAAPTPRSWFTPVAIAVATMAAALLVMFLLRGNFPRVAGPDQPDPGPIATAPQPSAGQENLVGEDGSSRTLEDASGMLAFQDANNGPPRLGFVVEVVLTPNGVRQQVFLQALANQRIEFADDLLLDPDLQEDVLESRMLKGAIALDPDRDQANAKPSHKVSVVHLTATGEQIEFVIGELSARSEGVERMGFNVALDPTTMQQDRKLFEQLQDAQRRQLASNTGPQPIGRARRLALNVVLMTEQVGSLAGAATSMPTGSLFPAAPKTGSQRGNAGNEKAGNNRIGANTRFDVLFVIYEPFDPQSSN